jgi:hypothetical protein
MITNKDLNKATFDDTSTEDFDKLLAQYGQDNVVSEASKQCFRQIVAKLQQSKV